MIGSLSKRARANLLALAIVAFVLLLVFGRDIHLDFGSSADRGARIATEIGAESCTDSGYQLQNRLDGSSTSLYDCWLNGAYKCVTDQDGLARDVTAEAQLLFEDTLSGGRPHCAPYRP